MPEAAENARGESGAAVAAVILIGNEILSGRTRDANLSVIAQKLGRIGIRVRETRIIPDSRPEIVATLNDLRARFDHVLTTGGIGPTHDDITAAAVAAALNLPLRRHPEAWRRLDAYYAQIGVTFNDARAGMANMPEGATLIDNPISAAPGFSVGNVHVLAGVPKIMAAMLDLLLPRLGGGAPIRSVTVLSSLPEGTVAAELEKTQHRYPELEIGSYPAWTDKGMRLSLVLTGLDESRLNAAAADVVRMIETLGGKGEVQRG